MLAQYRRLRVYPRKGTASCGGAGCSLAVAIFLMAALFSGRAQTFFFHSCTICWRAKT